MDVTAQLDAILPDLQRLAAGIGTDQFDDPTPCAQFRVRDLFDHMIGGASAFAPQLRGEAPTEPGPMTDDQRHVALQAALDELGSAVKVPGAMERTVSLPFGDVPGEVLAKFLTLDGMVHAWDLARASGQTYSPPEELATEVLATAHQLIAPEMRDGDTFAAEVAIDPSAPAVDRLAAFTGRQV